MVTRSNEILTGAEEVAAHLGWHVNTLRKYAAKYPPSGTGFPAHLNGRWNVSKTDIEQWRAYVIRQESRHPESRRFRPEEPPEIAAIQGRPEKEIRTRAAPVPLPPVEEESGEAA